MKNPNGFGTVYKMSGKRRKKWRAVKTIGWDENGKQKRITIGYFESKQGAMEALGKYIYNPNAKVTFEEVYEMWFKNHSTKVSETRLKSIGYIYQKHLSPLKKNKIADISLQDLQEFFDNINLSSGSIRQIKGVVNMIFDFALKNDYIVKNISSFIELGKYKIVFDKKEFSQEEIDILWNNLNIPYVDTILILIYTGMRISEFLSLKIENINLEEKTIFVDQSKTTSGIRHIPIHYKILPLITKRMHNQEYLILNNQNKPFIYITYRQKFNIALKRIGIKKHSPHECRHTTATLLSNAGANPISIAKIMGHSNYNTTANIYTHKNKEELEKAITLV